MTQVGHRGGWSWSWSSVGTSVKKGIRKCGNNDLKVVRKCSKIGRLDVF